MTGFENLQHSSQWLGGAPQKLIADSKSAKVVLTHRQCSQSADRYFKLSRYRRGRQLAYARLARIRYDAHPLMGIRDQALDLGQWNFLAKLDGQRLAVAAHCADSHADGLDGNRMGLPAEDLVGLGAALPFLLADTIAHVFSDPGNQAAGEGHAKMLGRKALVAQDAGDFTVDIEYRRTRIAEQVLCREVNLTHLLQQLAHVLCAGAGRR